MFNKTFRDIAKPQVVAILDLIKRSSGLSVPEISRVLNMSYMGVKQHCVDLEKKGYLDTWRRAKQIGRPEKTYRLTAKAQTLFPQAGSELALEILQSVQQVYGPSAPDKLLFAHFQRKADGYLAKMKGRTLIEKASSFARLRDAEGCCSQVQFDPLNGFRITEYHSPYADLAEKFPAVHRMEELMFARVLGTDVARTEEHVAHQTIYTFRMSKIAPAALPAVEKVAEAVSTELTDSTSSTDMNSESGEADWTTADEADEADEPASEHDEQPAEAELSVAHA